MDYKLEIGCLYLFRSTKGKHALVLVEEIDKGGRGGVFNALDRAWLFFKTWTPIGQIPLHSIPE